MIHPSYCFHQVDKYTVSSSAPLGSLLLVRLEKQRYWVEDNWFCRYVKVEPPGGASVLTFPCYRWLVGDIKLEIREGSGRTPGTKRSDTCEHALRTWSRSGDQTRRWSGLLTGWMKRK